MIMGLSLCHYLSNAVCCLTVVMMQPSPEPHRQIAGQGDPEQADADFELQELEKDEDAVQPELHATEHSHEIKRTIKPQRPARTSAAQPSYEAW